MAVVGGHWGASITMAISPSPSLLFPSTFLTEQQQHEQHSNGERGILVTEHILPHFTLASPSSSWNRDEKQDFFDGTTTNKSISMTNVLDTVGFTLQMFLNGTRRLHTDTSIAAISSFATAASTQATSDADITALTFPSSSEEDAINNGSSSLTTPSTAVNTQQASFPGKNVIIPLYTLIFFLSFFGNLMVILTLARNRRMRTVTNVLLLNLAVSDLLLGVFCMPVTLIGQLLRNFIFGATMCRILPYFQAVSVSVGVWTLVAISLERYFAICRPLQSRKWQTRSHAYKMILAVWLFTLTWNLPITYVSTLQPIRNSGRYKCREIWPSAESEKVFNLVLDFLLLLIPLCIMGLAYSLIVSKLWKGLQSEIRHTRSFRQHGPHGHLIPKEDSLELSTHSPYLNCKLGGCTENGGSSTCGSRMCMTSCNQTRENVSNEIVTFRGGKGVVVRWRRKNAIEVADTSTSTSTNNGHRVNCTRCAAAAAAATASTQDNHPHHHHNRLQCTTNNHGHSQNLLKQNGHSHGGGCGANRQASHGNCHLPHQQSVASQQQQQQQHQQQPQQPSSNKMARAIRSTYTGKSMESKKKVIRMLFVLVAEFFVCWTPLYVMNTWYLFDSEAVYNHIGPFGVVLIQLLAYISSCCNPITYCFMNRKFRQAFIKVFQCSNPRTVTKTGPQTIGRGSDMSPNDSLIYGAPPSTLNKSVLVLECENRV